MKNKIVQGKLLSLIFFCLLSFVFFQAESNATEYLRADFSVGYTNGTNLVGQNGWGQVGTSNTNGPIQVTNNIVSLKGSSTSTQNQSAYLIFQTPLDLTNTSTTNVFYYVLENLKVDMAYVDSNGGGSGVATLNTSTNGSGSACGRLFIRKAGGLTNSTTFNLGISSSGSSTSYGTSSLITNTSYKVVVAYTANPTNLDIIMVYVNPIGLNPQNWTPEVTQTNGTDPGTTMNSFVLQQGASSKGYNQFTMGRILVTDSVSDFNSPTFSYSPPSITGTAGISISPYVPIQSGEFTRFSIQPSLPSGLAINAGTGEVSGTPTDSSSSTYTVTGSDSSGTMTATNQISITIQPPLIVYSPSAIQGSIGAYLSVVPTKNGMITSYAISPVLPLGLTFDSLTGQISGLPLSEVSSTHNVTVQGPAGSYTKTITLQISSPTSLFNLPGASNFIQQTSGDVVTTINDTSGSISTLQVAINSARAANATRFLIINLKSNTEYLVTTSPLILGSKMCLSGASNTSIAASSSTTATSLIKITGGSSYTSVNFLTLNGNRANLYGIEAPGVNRVNLDQLMIRKTGKDGIFMQGLGSGVFDNEVTVTRCEVSEATTAAGIHLSDTTQAVCLDNLSYNNSYGILLESSAHAALVNNQAKFNTDSGICLNNASSNKITHNLCQGNSIGLSIKGTTTSNLRNVFVFNEIRTSSQGISLGGFANVLYDNLIASDVTSPLVLRTGSEAGVNRIIPTSGPLSATGQDYFYPPTSLNPHTSTIINGKNRIEVTTSDTTLSGIQSTYNANRTSYPSDVIILKLTAPIITGDAPLSLSSNTCVLLDGTIKLNSGVTAFAATSSSYISISGGTIDGQNYAAARNGFAFANCSRILIKKVSLVNFGNKTVRTDSDVIAFAGCTAPCIVSDCTINGGSGRGIWTKGNSTSSTSGFIFNDNSVSNVNMDGIDFDVTTSASLAIDNICSDNMRYGIFTEEGAKQNHVIRNICSGNDIGLNVYTSSETQINPTIQNTFIANACYRNNRGLRFGALSPWETSQNFAFNNQISRSSRSGIDAQSTGSENYISQSFLLDNTLPLESITSAIFFNSPSTSYSFALSTGYFDWQKSFAWSASTSLPDADPNGNGLPNLLEYALDLNPLSTTPPTLPVVGWDTITPDGPWLTFTYRRNKFAMDLTYGIQTSTDLVNWSSIIPNQTSLISEVANSNPDGDGTSELLRMRIKTSPTESKRFVRLSVTRQ